MSGKPMDLYTLDEAEADKAISGLSASLLDVPGNYTYANTIWQDRLGEGVNITEAVKKEGRDSVLNKIRSYYKDKAITDAKLQFGVAIGYAKPKVNEKNKPYFERDKQLRSLSLQKSGGGLDSEKINGTDYYVEKPTKFIKNSKNSAREIKLQTMVVPKVTDAMGIGKLSDKDKEFHMWIKDSRETKDKQYPLVLNYEAWRSSTGNLVPRKQIQ